MSPAIHAWEDVDISPDIAHTATARGPINALAAAVGIFVVIIIVKALLFCTNGLCFKRQSAPPAPADPEGRRSSLAKEQADGYQLAARGDVNDALCEVADTSATTPYSMALPVGSPVPVPGDELGVHRSNSVSTPLHLPPDLAAFGSFSLPGPNSAHSQSQPSGLEDSKAAPETSFCFDFPAKPRAFDFAGRSSSTEPLERNDPILPAPSTRSQSFKVSSSPHVLPRVGPKRPRPSLSLNLPKNYDDQEEKNDELKLDSVSKVYTKEDLIGLVFDEKTKTTLNEEYWDIPLNETKRAVALSAHKNRYNKYPNRSSMVRLPQVDGDFNSSYINANYVPGYKAKPKEYIATQGPLENTIVDFWRMIWSEESELIVMICKFKEERSIGIGAAPSTERSGRTVEKCTRYWPGAFTGGLAESGCPWQQDIGSTALYHPFTVTVVDSCVSSDCYIRTHLRLTNSLYPDVVRDIQHFWHVKWEDQGVADDPKAVISFIQDVRRMRESLSRDKPVVIHCSAGIGRTGCFSALDIAFQELENEDSVDLQRIVAQLRKGRGGLVQNCDQYRFLYSCLQIHAQQFTSV